MVTFNSRFSSQANPTANFLRVVGVAAGANRLENLLGIHDIWEFSMAYFFRVVRLA